MTIEFEQTLQSFRPKLLRTIHLQSVHQRAEPRHGWRYAAAGLAGFFLGISVMYFVMQPVAEVAVPAFAERVVVLPLDDQTMGTLRSPADLTKIRPRTLFVRPIEPPNILTPISLSVIPAKAGT